MENYIKLDSAIKEFKKAIIKSNDEKTGFAVQKVTIAIKALVTPSPQGEILLYFPTVKDTVENTKCSDMLSCLNISFALMPLEEETKEKEVQKELKDPSLNLNTNLDTLNQQPNNYVFCNPTMLKTLLSST